MKSAPVLVPLLLSSILFGSLLLSVGYGTGKGMSAAKTEKARSGSSARTRDVDPDPNFYPGDNAIAGQYVVAVSDSGGGTTAQSAIAVPLSTTASDLCTHYGGQVVETYDHVLMFTANNLTETPIRLKTG